MSKKDILKEYLIEQEPYIGSEIENVVLTRSRGLITPEQSAGLMSVFAAAGLSVVGEPLASLLEIKSSRHKLALDMIDEMSLRDDAFLKAAQGAGYAVEKTGFLGRFTLEEAIAHRAPNERFDSVMGYFLKNGEELAAHQPLMTSSVHISISYADIDHAYDMAKLFMVMTPILTHLTDNGGFEYEGKPCVFNPATTVRLSQSDGRGGLSAVVSGASSPEDMMKRQAEHLWNTPMMMHLDKAGEMREANKKGRRPTLSQLEGKKLNTASNVYLTESMQYQLLKLTSIRGSDGKPKGKRLELRMADNGPYQHDLMAIMAESIGLDKSFRKALGKEFTRAGLNPASFDAALKANMALRDVAARQTGFDYGNQSFERISARVLDMVEERFGAHDALYQARQSLSL